MRFGLRTSARARERRGPGGNTDAQRRPPAGRLGGEDATPLVTGVRSELESQLPASTQGPGDGSVPFQL